MRPMLKVSLAAALATTSIGAAGSTAEAHALWVTPAPRDQQDGYKDPPRAPPGTGAPCGISRAVPPQPETTGLTPGQALHVEWTETVTHPGCFVVDFAASGDADFQILGVKSHAGAAGGTPRSWSLDITLPNVSCATCTLRLRQLMLGADLPDAQCPPATIPAGSTYYSCANVALGSEPTGGTGGSGTMADSGGCSCGMASATPERTLAGLLAVAAIALATAVRRRRRTRSSQP